MRSLSYLWAWAIMVILPLAAVIWLAFLNLPVLICLLAIVICLRLIWHR